MNRMKHRLRALAISGFAAATLPACLPLPKAPAAHVTPAPTAQQATMAMHNGKTFAVEVSVPHDFDETCVADASLYVFGFQSGYSDQWNTELARPQHDAGDWLLAPKLCPIPNTSSATFNQSACRSLTQQKGYSEGQRRAHNDLLAHPPVP